MTAPILYEIYDMKTKKWLDGQWPARQVQKITGCGNKVAKYAQCQQIINGRYTLHMAGGVYSNSWERKWAREWDKIRFKLLGSGKHGEKQ